MSIFEGVTGGLLYQEANRLASAVIEHQGGLAELIAKLHEHGLGDVADSWVGNGANKSVSAGELRTVLSTDALANRFGLEPNGFAEALTRLLPDVVDRLTPGGELPKH